MKPAACLLTILVLFFMAQPILVNCQLQHKESIPAMKNCCGGKACHKNENNKKQESKDCDRTNACNPFAGCSGCQYIAASKYFYSPISAENISATMIKGTENIQPGFSNDCWNPPKLILL
jgi:hypothetical protein